MDNISNLPNEIICHIVSFLSAKVAAFTMVLSKRFLNLYNIIPNLYFDDKFQESLTDFADRVLALPLSTRIRRFSLRFSILSRNFETSHINRCLSDVLKRGVLDVQLRLSVGEAFSLPCEIFTCKTIAALKLEFGFYTHLRLPEKVFLPALETLCLNRVRFDDNYCGCVFQRLLSAYPLLVELVLLNVHWEYWKWSRIVSSPTLKRLTIYRVDYYGFQGFEFKSITFDTPSLVCLEYHDFVPDEYPIVNLDSLVEANLNLVLTVDHTWNDEAIGDDDLISSNPTNLLKGLKNVQILKLESPNSFETFYFFREAIPVFENLHHLSVRPYDDTFCWRFLPFLLNKSPNLKTLVIEGPLHCDRCKPESACECVSGYSCLLSCPVKVLEITKYKGTRRELEQMKHFLGKLSGLELVKLSIGTRDEEENLRLTTDLLMFPRASDNCKIHIDFSYPRFSHLRLFSYQNIHSILPS